MNPAQAVKQCLVMAALVALNIGCSGRDTYEFGHSLGRSKADCEALTSMDEREKCEREFDMDYDTYQRERDQL